MLVAKKGYGGSGEFGRILALAMGSFKASTDVLLLRAQYFHVIVQQGMDITKEMSFTVTKGQKAGLFE